MGIIFGKKKPVSRITQQDKAVLVIKNLPAIFLKNSRFSAIETTKRQAETISEKD